MDNSTPFRTFGTMLDCSRNAVPNLHTLKKWVDLTASLGYNTLLLYTEDTYEVPGQPYFATSAAVIPTRSCTLWMTMPICWALNFVPACRRWDI